MRASILVGIVALAGMMVGASGVVDPWDREAVLKEYTEGNWADAYTALRERIVTDRVNPHAVEDLRLASNCLDRLERIGELDGLLESAAELRAGDWRVLTEIARQYFEADHYASRTAGVVEREGGWGEVDLYDRDRVRALQLMVEARSLIEGATAVELGEFYEQFARILHGWGDWRLQRLTDLSTLPAFEERGYGFNRWRPAPVDRNGDPILYAVPESFESATNDGERWRWALDEAGKADPDRAPRTRLLYGEFTLEQFGLPRGFRYYSEARREKSQAELVTLTDDEVLAELASGVRRFRLPRAHHPIAIFRSLIDSDPLGTDQRLDRTVREAAYDHLARIYTSRCQYPRAAALIEEAIRLYGPGEKNVRGEHLEAIRGNWGSFEFGTTQVAGRRGTLEYRFRNGRRVTLTARPIAVGKLYDDFVALVREGRELPWQMHQWDNFPHGLLGWYGEESFGEPIASWEVALEPREAHFDRVVTIETPIEAAGVYWVEAQMEGGNRCFFVLWLVDTVIVRKQLDGGVLYLLADARTGEPVPGMKLDIFGYRRVKDEAGEPETQIESFERETDPDGMVVLEGLARGWTWRVRASDDSGRLALDGHSQFYRRGSRGPADLRAYGITDRPIYRPEETVQYKIWIQRVGPDREASSALAGKKVTVELWGPNGILADEHTTTIGEFGGVNGAFRLSADAKLGRYRIDVEGDRDDPLDLRQWGPTVAFRLEEYRKPEYEVTVVTPDDPVDLGSRAKLEIEARYFFGAPVRQGQVHYTIERETSYDGRWYPPRRWDWLYGPGYGYLGAEGRWHPGFDTWGCRRPGRGGYAYPYWFSDWFDYFGWGSEEYEGAELVTEGEETLGSDGKCAIVFDTERATREYGNQSQRYSVKVEVVDASRRTVEGRGEILVAKEHFEAFAWLDRGFYRPGDRVTARAMAVTLGGRAVVTTATARLYRVTHRSGELQEIEVLSETVESNEDGEVETTFRVQEPGQYRVAFTLCDSEGRELERARIFTVLGESLTAEEARFDPIELVAERREYAPGETLDFLINTERPGSTVLLFVRPVGRVCPEPEVIRMSGRTVLRSIEIRPSDQPNFLVEALTISGGRIYSELLNVRVPPTDRALDVTAKPAAAELEPGRGTSVTVEVRGSEGRPVVGDVVIAIYDSAAEAVVGGSNVPEILPFFWEFTRWYDPTTPSNLWRVFVSESATGESVMKYLWSLGAESNPFDEGVSSLIDFGGEGGEGVSPFGFGDGSAVEWIQPSLRSEFADTALWVASATTDESGRVTREVVLPDNVTTWKVRAWCLAEGTRVGEATAEIVARKNLLVRPQAPRFFLERDELVLSAVVHNELGSAKPTRVSIELDDSPLELLSDATRTVPIAARGEARVDWRVRVKEAGEARVRMVALTDEESDAVELTVPAHEYGAPTQQSFSGSLRTDETTGAIEFEVPEERRVEDTRLVIRYSPSIAAALVDALPYLVGYPYGCTEQTLNRFLPSVLVRSVLEDLDLDFAAIRAHRANLDPRAWGSPATQVGGWGRRATEPVFDREELDSMVEAGVERLDEMQLSDGGWGWFSGYGEWSHPHTTGLVVRGLARARRHEVSVPEHLLSGGYRWLEAYQDRQLRRLALPRGRKEHKSTADHIDAWVAFVLAEGGLSVSDMVDTLLRDRTRLTPYGLGLLGLACHLSERFEDRDRVIENLSQFEVNDDSNQTLHLRLGDANGWWYWYGSEIETQACYLILLAETDPYGEKARRLVKYLLENRRHASYWDSTRDTALCIEAIVDFLRVSEELSPDYELEVVLDGRVLETVSIREDNLFQFKDRVILERDAVTGGEHRIELRKKGRGALYYHAYVSTFSREAEIPPAGLDLQVERKVFRLHRSDETVDASGARGQPVEQDVIAYRREELASGADIESGDLLEVELTIESKNDYEYLLVEDFKAAGCEPVEALSGYNGNELGAYCEFRDRTVSFFVRFLPQGRRSVSYRLRAETPGTFSAMPAQASAMYASDLRGNSANTVLEIRDPR